MSQLKLVNKFGNLNSIILLLFKGVQVICSITALKLKVSSPTLFSWQEPVSVARTIPSTIV